MMACTNPRGALATDASQMRSNCSPLEEPTSVGAGGAPVAAVEVEVVEGELAPCTGETSPEAFMRYSCGVAPNGSEASAAPFMKDPWVTEEPSSLSASEEEALRLRELYQLCSCIFALLCVGEPGALHDGSHQRKSIMR